MRETDTGTCSECGKRDSTGKPCPTCGQRDSNPIAVTHWGQGHAERATEWLGHRKCRQCKTIYRADTGEPSGSTIRNQSVALLAFCVIGLLVVVGPSFLFQGGGGTAPEPPEIESPYSSLLESGAIEAGQ